MGSKGKGGSSPVPEVGTVKIFVSGIPKHATEADIKEHFSWFGEVVDVEVKVFQETGEPRGFSFVTFASVESAFAVLANYNDNMYEGRWIECKPAMAKEKGKLLGNEGCKGGGKISGEEVNERVYIQGLPQGTREQEVKDFCEQFGKTKEVALKYNSECVFRGFAFVTFESV